MDRFTKDTSTGTSQRYDVVVVGARCAGAATAMLLARQGLSVLLVERDRHGADTLSTLALMRAGVLELYRWGLLDRVRAAGTPPITSTSFIYGDETITVPIKSRNGVDALFAPRRTLIDALLADAALDSGADVVYGARLVDLERASDGRVIGAVIEERGGAVRRVGAGIVIGADGLWSTVVRLVGAATYREGRHACGVVYTFWPGLENARTRWYYRPGVAVGAIPTNGGDACVFTATPQARFHARDPDRHGSRLSAGAGRMCPGACRRGGGEDAVGAPARLSGAAGVDATESRSGLGAGRGCRLLQGSDHRARHQRRPARRRAAGAGRGTADPIVRWPSTNRPATSCLGSSSRSPTRSPGSSGTSTA